jgi:hypothetical protein
MNDLLLAQDFPESEHVSIQRRLIINDQRDIPSHISQVRDSSFHVTITDHSRITWSQHGVIHFPRWECREGYLIPVPNVDDGVTKTYVSDVLVDNLFLYF